MTTVHKLEKMHFFKDDQGRIVLWQKPNTPLYGWMIFKISSVIFSSYQLKTDFDDLSKAFLFTWAFLELTRGVNYFRRLLGLVVILVLVIGYFA